MDISHEEYGQLQPLLFSLGYRMLGSVKNAEDMVQETFLRAYEIDGEMVENKKAYLCKIMTNRCLDVLKSAQYKREQYMGPWIPEPLMLEGTIEKNPEAFLLQKEGLSIGYLRMMENLTTHERAVFLLREAFDFSYGEIASFIDKREDNCRKLYSRAKAKLAGVEEESLDFERNKSIIQQFIEAFQSQNLEQLLELVSEEVTLYSDGGGKVKAAIHPIVSRNHVLAFLQGIVRKSAEAISFTIQQINGQPAIVISMNGTLRSIVSFYICGKNIKEIYIIMNPDKLPLNKAELLEGEM